MAGSAEGAGLPQLTRNLLVEPDTAAADTPRSQEDLDCEASQLVQVYFTLEAPAERDALLDRIALLGSPLVVDFLRAMITQDEDEYVNAPPRLPSSPSVACQRASRCSRRASRMPRSRSSSRTRCAHSVRWRSGVLRHGPQDLGKTSERDAEERREAMLALETADAPRAMADFQRFVADQTDIAALADVFSSSWPRSPSRAKDTRRPCQSFVLCATASRKPISTPRSARSSSTSCRKGSIS